jgi:hypothetical protein
MNDTLPKEKDAYDRDLARIQAKSWPPPAGFVDLGRCTGHCCREMHLAGPLKLIDYADGTVEVNGHGPENEGPTIAAMAIPIRAKSPTESVYFCAHQRANGDCGIYARRPKVLCAEYPYGNRCTVRGCTWLAARLGLVAMEESILAFATMQPAF